MAEDLFIAEGTKLDKYEILLPQLKSLCENEPNSIANLANIAAAIKETFQYFWVGFYLIEKEELVLGPFQGPVACTRIQKGKGVCGTAWAQKKAILVPNVDEFPGHIACSSLSKSEIVLPLIVNDSVIGILDIDHTEYNAFDETDLAYLTDICTWLAPLL